MMIFSQRRQKNIRLEKSSKRWFDTVGLSKIQDADHFARQAFTGWTGMAW
ncbi:MAG: hypothetical protein IPP46_10860 [Bacteroidetes bacterium]|nr:hypothetical protein [Bacteroidota bacterium]